MNPSAEAAAGKGTMGRAALQLFGAALGLRAALLAVVFLVRREPWEHFLTTSDAGSFIAAGKVIYGASPASVLSLYDTRVFPGWPLLFGWGLRLGLPDPFVLAFSVVLAALVPVLFLRLTGERVLAWYLVYLPPAWLVASSHPISEPAYLAVMLLGLLALKAGRPAWAGAAGGFLVVLRAFGIAWLGATLLALLVGARRLSRPVLLAGLAAAVPIAGLFALNLHLYGDPLHQLHVYARPLQDLNIPPVLAASLHNPSGHWGWPFEHLLLTPWRTPVPLWKTVYIYAHIPVLVVLFGRGLRQLGRSLEPWDRALVLGFLANAALIVCTGPYWGFESFDRYFVWGLPGALWLARPWLGAQPRWHWVLGPLSVAIALRALLSHLG